MQKKIAKSVQGEGRSAPHPDNNTVKTSKIWRIYGMLNQNVVHFNEWTYKNMKKYCVGVVDRLPLG